MFSKSTFGAPTTNTGFGFSPNVNPNPFGPSTFGKTPTTGFGQQNAFGSASTPLFGQTTQQHGLFSTPAPTAFGQPVTTQPAFGNTSALGGNSIFGTTPSQTTTGGLFGSSSTSTFGQQNKTPGFGFGTNTANTGFFGQTSTAGQPQPQSSGIFGQTTTNLFGSAGAFGAAPTNQMGTVIKFNPVCGTDTMMKGSNTQPISTRHHCITCMKEYENKSLEELRWEDYQVNRKGPQQGAQPSSGIFSSMSQPVGGGLFGTTPATSTNTLFGQQENKSVFGNPGTTSAFGQTSTVFGNPAAPNTSSTGLFAKTLTTGFGTTTSTTPAFPFSSTATQPTTNIFGATTANKAFGATPQQGTLFGQPNTFGAPQQTFGNFGQPQNQNVNMFNQNKTPAFSMPTTTTNTFGSFGAPAQQQPQTSSLFSGTKSTTGFTPFGATATPSFGQATFGQTAPAAGGLFTNTFNKTTTPFFGQTTTANTMGSTGLTLGTGTSLFGLGGFGATNNNMTFNLAGTPAQQGIQPVDSSQLSSEQQIISMSSTPYGLPNLLNHITDFDQDVKESTRPTNPTELNALLNTVTKASPSPKSEKLLPRQIFARKLPMFDGLEEQDDTLLTNLRVKHNPKRLVIRNKEIKSILEQNSVVSMNNTINLIDNEVHKNTKSVLEDSVESTSTSQTDLCKSITNGNSTNTKNGDIPSISSKSSLVLLDSDGESESNEDENELFIEAKDDLENQEELVPNPACPSNNNDLPTSNSSGDVSAKNHPTGIVLTRPEYYTVPSLDELIKFIAEDGTCVVQGFTIGRVGYGNVFFPDAFDVSNLNLDNLVFIRHKEVIIYPKNSEKPPLGEGLNRKAQITLDNVWPVDKIAKEVVSDIDVLIGIDYSTRLRHLCEKQGTRFIDYRPETGSWVFCVDHFSKYGTEASDEDAETKLLREFKANKDQNKSLNQSLTQSGDALKSPTDKEQQKQLSSVSQQMDTTYTIDEDISKVLNTVASPQTNHYVSPPLKQFTKTLASRLLNSASTSSLSTNASASPVNNESALLLNGSNIMLTNNNSPLLTGSKLQFYSTLSTSNSPIVKDKDVSNTTNIVTPNSSKLSNESIKSANDSPALNKFTNFVETMPHLNNYMGTPPLRNIPNTDVPTNTFNKPITGIPKSLNEIIASSQKSNSPGNISMLSISKSNILSSPEDNQDISKSTTISSPKSLTTLQNGVRLFSKNALSPPLKTKSKSPNSSRTKNVSNMGKAILDKLIKDNLNKSKSPSLNVKVSPKNLIITHSKPNAILMDIENDLRETDKSPKKLLKSSDKSKSKPPIAKLMDIDDTDNLGYGITNDDCESDTSYLYVDKMFKMHENDFSMKKDIMRTNFFDTEGSISDTCEAGEELLELSNFVSKSSPKRDGEDTENVDQQFLPLNIFEDEDLVSALDEPDPDVECFDEVEILENFLPVDDRFFNSTMYADMTAFKGNSFKVKWGRNLTFLTLGNQDSLIDLKKAITTHYHLPITTRIISVNKIVNNRIELEKDKENDLEKCFSYQLKNISIDFDDNVPHISVVKGNKLLKLYQEHSKKNNYQQQIWNLCDLLWNNIDKALDVFDNRTARKILLTNWIKSLDKRVEVTECKTNEEKKDEDKDTEMSIRESEGSTTDDYGVIFEEEKTEDDLLNDILQCLSCNQIDDATEVAFKMDNIYLAMFISQLPSNHMVRTTIKQQLDDWNKNNIYDLINPILWKIYSIISGEPFISYGDDNLCIYENMNWIKVFAMYLWYITNPEDPIEVAVEKYEKDFKQYINTEKPLPEYPGASENIYDLRFQLLKFYSNNNYPLTETLNPLTHTDDMLDYRLSWFLLQVIDSLGQIVLNENEKVYIHTSFAAQLEQLDLWHWAIFVLLFIKDCKLRQYYVQDVIERHIEVQNEASKEYTEKERMIIHEFKVPTEWFDSKKATLSLNKLNYQEAIYYMFNAKEWQRAYNCIMEHILPQPFMCYDYRFIVASLSQMTAYAEEIKDWNMAGGLLLDFAKLGVEYNDLFKKGDISLIKNNFTKYRNAFYSIYFRWKSCIVLATQHSMYFAEMTGRICEMYRKILYIVKGWTTDTYTDTIYNSQNAIKYTDEFLKELESTSIEFTCPQPAISYVMNTV